VQALRRRHAGRTTRMHSFTQRRWLAGLALSAALLPWQGAKAQTSGSGGREPERPSGRVIISQTQASLLGSVAWGSGTLAYEGRSHRLRIRGIGIGGIGITRMTAAGDVFNLASLRDFPGVYGQARAGAVAGTAQVQGGIWLQNPAGVRLYLRPEREGVALQVGADGMLIELE
jgi:hypothetical protein